ncbi:Uncharacterized protein BP5553_04467 [Venustampulla echinocandica]|uniref:P-loop containing nucleoside triphosphate hydrolase n=1 Tax=Venustampulla echinocandica TaxID=2656787 RepID=A0A370TNE0_9HELO|nr:Uncharacterized protein BP5553_04467 [Venustampulla echinocandica]RDL37034.1 Uncharacterized protein BP5553_04467 [Venustampulla echinocandica]
MSNSFPERKILPVRSRKSLGQRGERRNISNSDQGQLSTLPLSADAQRLEQPLEISPASNNLSPRRPKSANAANVTTSQTGNFLTSSYEDNGFEFGGGAAPPLDTMRFSPSLGSQTRSSDLSLPILSRLEPEDPQSLHTLYSDEKIVATTENEDLGMPIPVLLDGRLASTGAGPSTPPQTQLPPFSQMSELGSSSSLYLHGRSVSATSFTSDISYNSDPTSPYIVGSEEAPLEPFFTSTFQTALQRGLDIAKDAASAMEEAGLSIVEGGVLQRLISDAKGLSTFKGPGTRTIAILGDSGEGKSSLINALLHFPDIAKTGDIGAACTSVVTEYRQKTAIHVAPITIEVEYLSMSEIEDLIKELIWNYRRIYLPHSEGENVTENEYTMMQRVSEQAWSSLEAGFSHQREFSKDLLINDMSEAGLAIANNQLVQWAHELNWPDSGESGKWTSTADTADECCEKTSVFMQDRFWPFTKIIRVYLGADVLKTGVVLADLPGLHDTNLARDINQKAARREFCGPNKRIAEEVMMKFDKDIEEAKRRGDKSLKKQLKRKQELLLINARSIHVKEGLQRTYSSKIPKGELEVFCVSNTTYEKFAKKGNVEMVQASGIPELRRFCYTITAHAQLLEAKNCLRSMLSSLLNSAKLWAAKPTEPQQTVEANLDESIYFAVDNRKQEESLDAVSRAKNEFKETFQELVLELLDKQNEAWENVAAQNGRTWCTVWHWSNVSIHSQYNAWCRKDGDHWTEKRGKVNWNADLIWKMRMEMAFQWETLEDDIPTLFETLFQSAKAPILELQSEMRGKLKDIVLVRIQDIKYKFSLAEKSFAKEVRIVRSKASEPNESSYVLAEMLPAYRSAAQECGVGKGARQQHTVQGRITNGTLFPNISRAIKNDIEATAKAAFSTLQKSLVSVFVPIENDIAIALACAPQQPSNMEVVGREEEERRRGELADAVQGLMRQHAEVLASIADI